MRCAAHLGLIVSFYGKNAHAGANPWDGINALDAIVSAYTSISMLRQHMRPDERIHGCIMEAPKVTNVVPKYTQVMYSIRAPTMGATRILSDKVRNCFEAAALATGCKVEIEEYVVLFFLFFPFSPTDLLLRSCCCFSKNDTDLQHNVGSPCMPISGSTTPSAIATWRV